MATTTATVDKFTAGADVEIVDTDAVAATCAFSIRLLHHLGLVGLHASDLFLELDLPRFSVPDVGHVAVLVTFLA